MNKLLAILSVVLFVNQASARCAEDHMAKGWEPIQEGSIEIRDCGAEWPIKLGSYLLNCERHSTSYFGHAVLFEKQDMMGVSHTLFSICLIDNDEALDVKVLNNPFS